MPCSGHRADPGGALGSHRDGAAAHARGHGVGPEIHRLQRVPRRCGTAGLYKAQLGRRTKKEVTLRNTELGG